MALLPFLFFFLFGALVVALLIYSWQKEKQRTQQFQATAGQLGWSFLPQAQLNMITGLERFPLFSHGHGKQIKNMMYGEANGIKAAVFDYRYTVGHGKNSHTYFQTVVYLEPGYINFPEFTLRPEGFFSKMLQAFGYQDIDFGQRPEFSKHYLLRGPDEPAIRAAFNDSLLAFYESYPRTCTDADANQLLVFRSGHRFEPQEAQSYVGLALNLMNLFPR